MDAIVYVSFDESSLPPKYNAKSFYVDGSCIDYSTSLPIDRSADVSMPEPIIQVSATVTVPSPAAYNNAGSNRVPNGDASMGNITNFPGMTYIADDGCNSPGCFQRAAYTDFHSTTLMPIDINRKYTIQGAFKSAGAGGLSRLYFGVTCYDKNGFYIQCRQAYHLLNTETTLAQPLNNGDTVVYLTSVANWRTGTQGAFGYDKMFGAWLPADGYDNYTYTRRVQPYVSVDAVNNTVTLQVAWAQGSIPAGSAVANTYDSGTYNYTAASYAAVPTEWTTYAGTITGVSATGLASAFRYGTMHVGVMALMNYGQDATYVTRLDDVIFQDVGADLEVVPELSGNATIGVTTGAVSSAGISPSISWGSTVNGTTGATNIGGAAPTINVSAAIAVPYPAAYSNTGINHVLNGDLSSGDNTNFPGTVYVADDGANALGCVECAGDVTFHSTALIPVDVNRTYNIIGTFKSVGVGGLSSLYFGISCYDRDGQPIMGYNCLHLVNTETTLAQPLNDGDTVVYLTSAANWTVGTQGTTGIRKQLGVWLPSDGYDNYTYTRRVQPYISVDAVAKTITLETAWSHGSIPAGTAIANNITGMWPYIFAGVSGTAVPTEWTTYAGTITGLSNNNIEYHSFRYGTAQIAIAAYINHAQDATCVTRIDDIIFRDTGADAEVAPELLASATINGTVGSTNTAALTATWVLDTNVNIELARCSCGVSCPEVNVGATLYPDVSSATAAGVEPSVLAVRNPQLDAVTANTTIAAATPDIEAIRNPQVEAIPTEGAIEFLTPEICTEAVVPAAISITTTTALASDAIADAVTIIDSYASASQNALVAGAGGGVGALPAESLCEAPVSDVIGDALTTIELGTVQAAIATPNATADAIVSSVTGTSITDGLFVETCGNSLLEASVASLDATGQVQEVTAAALLTAPVATMQLSSEAPLLSGDAITNIDAACVSVALLESIPSGSALQVLDITEPAILQAVAPISSICPMAAAASTNVLTCSATGTAIVLPDMGAITIKCLAPDAVSIVTTDITCTANASAEASEAAVFGSADIVAPTTDSVAAAAAPLPIEDPVPVGITVTIDADCQAYVPAVLGCAGIAPEASDVTIAAKEPEFSGDAILSVEVAISSAQAMVAVPSANIELDILAASGSAQALSDISWQLSSNAVCSDAAQVTVITLIPMTYSPELKFAAYLMCYEQQTATSTQEHKRSAIVFVDNKADIVAFIPDTQYLAHLMQYEQQTGLDYHEHKDSIITYIEGASAVGIKTATGGNRILEALTNIKYTP